MMFVKTEDRGDHPRLFYACTIALI